MAGPDGSISMGRSGGRPIGEQMAYEEEEWRATQRKNRRDRRQAHAQGQPQQKDFFDELFGDPDTPPEDLESRD